MEEGQEGEEEEKEEERDHPQSATQLDSCTSVCGRARTCLMVLVEV